MRQRLKIMTVKLHTVIAVPVALYKHIVVHQPDHNVVHGTMYLTKGDAIIGGMYHVQDEIVLVHLVAILENEQRIVWWRELGTRSCQRHHQAYCFPPQVRPCEKCMKLGRKHGGRDL